MLAPVLLNTDYALAPSPKCCAIDVLQSRLALVLAVRDRCLLLATTMASSTSWRTLEGCRGEAAGGGSCSVVTTTALDRRGDRQCAVRTPPLEVRGAEHALGVEGVEHRTRVGEARVHCREALRVEAVHLPQCIARRTARARPRERQHSATPARSLRHVKWTRERVAGAGGRRWSYNKSLQAQQPRSTSSRADALDEAADGLRARGRRPRGPRSTRSGSLVAADGGAASRKCGRRSSQDGLAVLLLVTLSPMLAHDRATAERIAQRRRHGIRNQVVVRDELALDPEPTRPLRFPLREHARAVAGRRDLAE